MLWFKYINLFLIKKSESDNVKVSWDFSKRKQSPNKLKFWFFFFLKKEKVLVKYFCIFVFLYKKLEINLRLPRIEVKKDFFKSTTWEEKSLVLSSTLKSNKLSLAFFVLKKNFKKFKKFNSLIFVFFFKNKFFENQLLNCNKLDNLENILNKKFSTVKKDAKKKEKKKKELKK